jgi:hypothetical protein
VDRWLKRGTLSKESSATTVTTGVTDAVSESKRFSSSSGIDSSRIAESSKKLRYSDSYLSLGCTHTGDEIAPDGLCVLCNNVLPNSSMLPAKLRRHRDTKSPCM